MQALMCEQATLNSMQNLTDTQLIIIITLFTLFTRITLNVFGKALCPCQSI